MMVRPNRKIFVFLSFLEAGVNRWHKPVIRWPLVVGYLGILIVLLACGTSAAVTATPVSTSTEAVSLQLDNGAVQMRDENGDWIPVGAETTFEIVGGLESTDPWMVTGNTFAAREWTRIDEDLEVGDPVRVKGVILEDATWLAFSIERLEEQTSPTIIIIGKVASIDPWVVNGITLNVTTDTLISEGITLEMIVRVEILLLEDGTWEVLSISPLGTFTDVPGCATVTATVVSMNGDELRLAGWPPVTLDDGVIIENDAGDEGILSANQAILIVVCASEEGQIRITHIIILNLSNSDAPVGGEGEKVLICHKPDKKGGHTLSVASSAIPAHLGHGDKLGPCP
jgi:hypothetical protein